MPKYIAEIDTIKALTSAQRGGVVNPNKDWFDFLVATGNTFGLTKRSEVKGIVRRHYGEDIPNGRMYVSTQIDEREIRFNETLAVLAEFAGLGLYLDVVGYPAFVKMGAVKYAQDVPSYLPNATKDIGDEENPNIVPVTWSEWFDDNNNHLEFEGSHYIPLTSNTRGRMPSMAMMVRLEADGYNVKQMSTWPVIESEV